MSLRSTCRGLVVCVSVELIAPGPALAEQAAPGAPTVFVQGPAALDVSRALADAVSRLKAPGCQRVLDDFKDDEGRPVRARLGETRLGLRAKRIGTVEHAYSHGALDLTRKALDLAQAWIDKEGLGT